jgi:hypothetical protein
MVHIHTSAPSQPPSDLGEADYPHFTDENQVLGLKEQSPSPQCPHVGWRSRHSVTSGSMYKQAGCPGVPHNGALHCPSSPLAGLPMGGGWL